MEHDQWQELMDKAYNRWQEGGDLHRRPYREFIDELIPLQRKAVLLGNLNYQVNNGGFSQWIMNGYALEAERVERLLREIGTPTCLKVADLVKQIVPLIDFESRDHGCMGSYLKSERRQRERRRYEEDEGEEEHESFEKLDDEFFDINNEVFMREIEAFFSAYALSA
jgi:hypothetical protein